MYVCRYVHRAGVKGLVHDGFKVNCNGSRFSFHKIKSYILIALMHFIFMAQVIKYLFGIQTFSRLWKSTAWPLLGPGQLLCSEAPGQEKKGYKELNKRMVVMYNKGTYLCINLMNIEYYTSAWFL